MDIIALFEQLAGTGHAPREGCSLFSAGYDDAFQRLQKQYLIDRFDRGGSGEKFVIGPFGSGKTHFIRHLQESARELDCVAAEVSLNKNVDFTKSMMVYQEVAREVRVPGSERKGIPALLSGCMDNIRRCCRNQEEAEDELREWVRDLRHQPFELNSFGTIAYRALQAQLDGNQTFFEGACRWLGGEVTNRALAKDLVLNPVTSSELNLHAQRALFSLAQLARLAKFRGTVLCFDEAEQGLGLPKKKMDCILSMLQSGLNAITDLKGASLLVVYAFTKDLVDEMERFEALRQRVSDPGPGMGFFDGNTLAPKIDLTQRSDPESDLRAMATRYVEVFYREVGEIPGLAKSEALELADQVAKEIAQENQATGARRMVAKRITTLLLGKYKGPGWADAAAAQADGPEDEV